LYWRQCKFSRTLRFSCRLESFDPLYRRSQSLSHVLQQVFTFLFRIRVFRTTPNDQTVGVEIGDRVERVLRIFLCRQVLGIDTMSRLTQTFQGARKDSPYSRSNLCDPDTWTSNREEFVVCADFFLLHVAPPILCPSQSPPDSPLWFSASSTRKASARPRAWRAKTFYGNYCLRLAPTCSVPSLSFRAIR